MGDMDTITLRRMNQHTLFSRLESYLASGTYVDVTLATSDGQHMQAHKLVLALSSTYFQELLSLEIYKSANTIIFLKDVKFSELKTLIQFMYRGEVAIAQTDFSSLLAVAKSLKIHGLCSNEDLDKSSSTEIGPILYVNDDFKGTSQNSLVNGTQHHPKSAVLTNEQGHPSPDQSSISPGMKSVRVRWQGGVKLSPRRPTTAPKRFHASPPDIRAKKKKIQSPSSSTTRVRCFPPPVCDDDRWSSSDLESYSLTSDSEQGVQGENDLAEEAGVKDVFDETSGTVEEMEIEDGDLNVVDTVEDYGEDEVGRSKPENGDEDHTLSDMEEILRRADELRDGDTTESESDTEMMDVPDKKGGVGGSESAKDQKANDAEVRGQDVSKENEYDAQLGKNAKKPVNVEVKSGAPSKRSDAGAAANSSTVDEDRVDVGKPVPDGRDNKIAADDDPSRVLTRSVERARKKHPFKCARCGRGFRFLYGLEEHQEYICGDPLEMECRFCSKLFRRKLDILTHEKTCPKRPDQSGQDDVRNEKSPPGQNAGGVVKN